MAESINNNIIIIKIYIKIKETKLNRLINY